MKVETGTLIWSFPAHACFGIQNFLIGYTNQLAIDKWATIGALWFVSGLTGLAAALRFVPQQRSLFFSEPLLPDTEKVGPITAKVKLVTILGGFCVGFSQLMMKAAFGRAPSLSGPLCAVISSDVIIVSTFCHFVYHELMNLKQVAAVLSIVTGLCIMAVCSAGSSSAGGDESQETPIVAFGLSLLGMVSFACAVLAIRVGCLSNLAAWSGFVVRMLVLLLIGSLAFGYSVLTAGWPVADLKEWGAPALAGLMQAGGVLCVNKALQFPNTGIANAIFASNSVDVLLLNLLVFGLVPDMGSLAGMCIVVVAVAGISLMEDAAAEPEQIHTPDSVLSPSTSPRKSISRMNSYGSPLDLQCDRGGWASCDRRLGQL